MKSWVKIDRLSAWVLLVGMILYFISGFGMTKGIIDANLATKLHLDWLTIIIIIAFTVHAGYATRIALIRWRVWNAAGKAVWFLFFLAFFSGFLYIDLLYAPYTSGEQAEAPATSTLNTNSTSTKTQQNPVAVNTPSATPQTTSTFSKIELAKYNGKNGQPAYVAVDGLVYDVTSVFNNGLHFSHIAGNELTNAFYSRHAKFSITKYPVVGKYSG